MRRVRTATHSAVLGLLSIGLFNAFAPAAYASGKPPVLQTPPTLTATVGKPFSYTPSIKDPEGDKLNVRLYNVPAWITIDRATGRIYGTPPTVATHGWLAYKVYDGTGSTTGGWFTINVVKAAANVAPTIYGTPTTKVAVNTTYSFQPTARDANGDKLTFSISNRPAWATFDTSTGRLSGKPTSAGTFSKITIRVSDGRLAATLAPFTVTVTGTQNAAPVITGTPATSVSAGKTYSFTPKASDPNGDKLTFSIVNKPTWAAFNTTTGALTGTPTTAQAGTYANVTIRVTDGRLTASLPAFTLTVTGAQNAAPVISGTPATSVNAGTAYSFTPKASDANGDTLAFSIVNKPTWAVFNTTTGALTGTPSASQVGSYSNITIRVSDGRVTTTLAPFSIAVVQASNGAATLSWTPPTQNTDGTSLTNLAGYRIYYGTSANALTQVIQVPNAGVATYMVENLAPATYYFALRAYNTQGAESASSNVVSKVVR